MTDNKQRIIIKKWLTAGNGFNLLLAAVILLLLFNSSAKAFLIRGLMKVGLFQPAIEKVSNHSSVVGNVIFKDIVGREVSLPALKGKVIIINFWATWCPPCVAELPSLNELHQKFLSNLNIVFLFVDVDNDLQKARLFTGKHNLQLPLYNAVSAIPNTMLGNSIPTTVVVNKTGKIVFRHDGAADYTNHDFVSFLKKLILQ